MRQLGLHADGRQQPHAQAAIFLAEGKPEEPCVLEHIVHGLGHLTRLVKLGLVFRDVRHNLPGHLDEGRDLLGQVEVHVQFSRCFSGIATPRRASAALFIGRTFAMTEDAIHPFLPHI